MSFLLWHGWPPPAMSSVALLWLELLFIAQQWLLYIILCDRNRPQVQLPSHNNNIHTRSMHAAVLFYATSRVQCYWQIDKLSILQSVCLSPFLGRKRYEYILSTTMILINLNAF